MRESLRIVVWLNNGSKSVIRVSRVGEATTGVAQIKIVAILTLPTGATDSAQTMVAVDIHMDS